MNILAIETSVSQASLCLHRRGNLSYYASWQAERNHDAHLFPALEKALDALEGAPLDYILVGAGPGSYGGVRVALAAGVGISTVTGARLVAIDSWAQLVGAEQACIISDARRGGWTLRRPTGEISVLSTPEILKEQQNGTLLYSVETSTALTEKGLLPPAQESLVPTASGLVETWLQMSEAERQKALERPAEPIYVRPPHITKAVRKPWEIPH